MVFTEVLCFLWFKWMKMMPDSGGGVGGGRDDLGQEPSRVWCRVSGVDPALPQTSWDLPVFGGALILRLSSPPVMGQTLLLLLQGLTEVIGQKHPEQNRP